MADDEMLRAKDWPWLADQLVEWPDRRVHPERTMSIGSLHKMGADVIRKAVMLEAAAQKLLAAFGGNVPDWLQDEAATLEEALSGTRPKTDNEKLGDGLIELGETGAILDQLGGNCPVQAEGTIDGVRFYFRARGSHWEFHVAQTDADLFKNELFSIDRSYKPGDDFAAGWMPQHEAVAFMIEGIAAYRANRDLTDAYEAQGKPGSFADWVQSMADDPKGTLQNAAKAWLEPQL